MKKTLFPLTNKGLWCFNRHVVYVETEGAGAPEHTGPGDGFPVRGEREEKQWRFSERSWRLSQPYPACC